MNDNRASIPAPQDPPPGERGRLRLAVALALLFATVAGVILGIRGLAAAGTNATVYVSPSSTNRIWYKPTPITITINAANFSGAGLTPISGWQYGLQWDPTVLKWISGPNVGPGTPTPPPILPCLSAMITWGTATPTPFGLLATYTPTFTSTPMSGTPSNTPTATYTPSQTPTPGGYVQVACATLSQVTPVPNGVLGTYQFQPIATAKASSPLNLINVKVVDFYGNTVVPAVTAVPGNVTLVNCYDLDGNGVVNIVDLALVAAHYGAVSPNPDYVAAYDPNKDGRINVQDLGLVAAAYGQTC
ncbi:MAG: hypothetical protein KGK07_13175 [Chloroflexota bacterium]|nr:hypothetical protein [Chloroflexota bacterium]